MKTLILIPGQDAVWRYDQIAGIEVVESTVSLFIIGSPMDEDSRRDYEYENDDEAKKSFIQIVTAWKEALSQ